MDCGQSQASFFHPSQIFGKKSGRRQSFWDNAMLRPLLSLHAEQPGGRDFRSGRHYSSVR